jgi:hypothetical protein
LDDESDLAPDGGHVSLFELERVAMRGACSLPPTAVCVARTTLTFAAGLVQAAATRDPSRCRDDPQRLADALADAHEALLARLSLRGALAGALAAPVADAPLETGA